MESYSWILLAAGVLTTAARVGWGGPRAVLPVVCAWAVVPWLTSSHVAGVSASKLFAWASEPDRVGLLAAFVATEAIAGGWVALYLAGSKPGGGGRNLLRWGAALAPSPALAAGLIGAQASLFRRASGWNFSTIDVGLSLTTFAALAGPAWAYRRLAPELSRRASAVLPIYAALFAFGAALPPLLDPRPKGARPVDADLKSTAVLAVLAALGVGLGAASRLVRSFAARKGVEVS